eukprot:6316043-Lingulodinium_polyedra.AAC.1
MTEPHVKNLLKLYQSRGDYVTHTQEHDMEILIESGKDTMLAEAKRLVQEAGLSPVMVSYSSDETRVKVQKRLLLGQGEKGQVSKEGTQGVGILVQHHFLRYIDAGGSTHSCALLMEPK